MKHISILALSLFLLNITLIKAQDSTLSNRLHDHVSILASDSLEGRGLGTETMQQTREYIIKQFESIGLKPLNDTYTHNFSMRFNQARVKGVNILGLIEGTDPVLKNEYIVLGAHYDHLGWKYEKGEKVIYNGADDNASGTAGIIEIARQMLNSGKEFKRSIVFIAFDGEESGLRGSKRLLNDSILNPAQIKCMFSLDMIGMYDANNGVELNGIESMIGGETLVDASKTSKNIRISKINDNIGRRTDTHPFGKLGIPAIHVFTNTKSPYHKPEDDSHLLDYEGMADIVEFMTILTEQIAEKESIEPTEELLAYAKGKEPKGESSMITLGVRLNTGSTYNNFPDEFYRAHGLFSASTGLFCKIKINNNLAIQPEVLYSFTGSEYINNDNLRTHSVMTPVHIVYGTDDSKDGRFFAFAGGYYNYNFAGNIGSTELNFGADYAEQSYGLSYGFCIEAQRKVQFGMNVFTGLSDLELMNSNGKVLQNGMFFTLGYIF